MAEEQERYWEGKNAWFDRNYSQKITPEFAKWWQVFEGLPRDHGEVRTYFYCMATAFESWEASRIHFSTKSEEK
jgi:hypothetical protein